MSETASTGHLSGAGMNARSLTRSRLPILVTGAHRSGTTWAGRLLAEAPGIYYIHEPFNISDPPIAGLCAAQIRRWFMYICSENEDEYLAPLRDTISLRYDLASMVRTLPSRWREIPAIPREYWKVRLAK